MIEVVEIVEDGTRAFRCQSDREVSQYAFSPAYWRHRVILPRRERPLSPAAVAISRGMASPNRRASIASGNRVDYGHPAAHFSGR